MNLLCPSCNEMPLIKITFIKKGKVLVIIKCKCGRLSRLRAQADEKSRTLIETIKSEGNKIQRYIKSKERQYKSNLFADSSTICEELLKKAKTAKSRIDECLEILSTEMTKMQEGIK